MFKVAVAHSLELDSSEAVADVLEQCREQLEDLEPQAGLLFAGIDHDFALILEEINGAYPNIQLIGSTTDGEMSSVHGYADDSLVLMAFCSDELVFEAGVADNIFQDEFQTTKSALQSALSSLGQEPVLCLTTPAGLTPKSLANGDNLLESLKLHLGETFPVFGGMACNQWRMENTYQFYNSSVFTVSLPFLLIGGPLLYSSAIESGWIPIGPKAKVTKSKGNVVRKIGTDTALQFYQHYLGDSVVSEVDPSVGEYPLAIFEVDGEGFHLRGGGVPIEGSGDLIFMGNVPEGAMVQISHVPSRDKIVEATEKAIRISVDEYPGREPLAAICFSGSSRKELLGTRIDEEYTVFKRSFPDLPVAGFYTYGGFAPLRKNEPAKYHSNSVVNLVLGLR
jgi:hypothetical protein